jgi:hypothetical protein
MSASEMELSMRRTRINNKWNKYIPTHVIIWCSGDIAYPNTLDKIVWATQNVYANINWIHIEVVGNFNVSKPSEKQYDVLRKIISDITVQHPDIEIKWHKDFQPHTCPWINFNFGELTKFVPIPHANGAKRPLPKVSWSTVENRTKSFIERYWYEYKHFLSQWLKNKIKPEVLVCIARTEWFGKNSGSTWNIMNCWNNDRWDRVSFGLYVESIACAASKLNGKWLWNKQTIWDLSFAWDGKIDMQYIYASSNWPRQINMLNCLWKIYDKNLDPSFTFRI